MELDVYNVQLNILGRFLFADSNTWHSRPTKLLRDELSFSWARSRQSATCRANVCGRCDPRGNKARSLTYHRTSTSVRSRSVKVGILITIRARDLPWTITPGSHLPKCRNHYRKYQVSQRKRDLYWISLLPWLDSILVQQNSCVSFFLVQESHAS
jgi:hypothetical protein